jgi:hypothetical protein
MARHVCAHTAGRRRAILSIRLRSLILIVLAVGACLGWWRYHLRCAAVNRILAVASSGIQQQYGPTSPELDGTYEPDRLIFLPHVNRVTTEHAEAMAEAQLADALRRARLRGDENSMSGALGALLWLGFESPDTVEQIVLTAQGSEMRGANRQRAVQIRCLAIHLLGRVAERNDEALRALIETLESAEPSTEQFVVASAANQLGALGGRAQVAVPVLVNALQATEGIAFTRLLRSSIIGALERLDPIAGPAAPRLIAIAEDPSEDNHTRLRAISALGAILPDRIVTGGEFTESHRTIIVALTRLVADGDMDIHRRAVQVLAGIRYRLRLSPGAETDLHWILRTEEQILGWRHPVVAATADHLRRVYLLQGKNAEAAELESEYERNIQ